MRRRILFYSHDSFGLGHFRRSLTTASYLARHIGGVTVLMLTGLDSAATFEAPPGVDFVKLPSIWKSGVDQYTTRHLRVSFRRVHRMRGQLILSVAHAFKPDLLVVDNVPLGVDGELLPTLRYLGKRQRATRIALTLRDVLDSPDAIVSRWQETGIYEALERFYDEIWVAGCRAVFDPTVLYRFPKALASRVKFCGYIVRSSPRDDAEDLIREFRLAESPFVVASCGGGGDGIPLIENYIEAALPLAREGLRSVVFLGPDMPAAKRRELKRRIFAKGRDFLVFDYRPDLVSFLLLARASVSMAGYNTICEVLSLGKPATVVPRIHPRVEQLLRARAFAARGLLEVVHPDQLSPEALRAAVKKSLACSRPPGGQALSPDIDFAGLSRITRRVCKQLGIERK